MFRIWRIPVKGNLHSGEDLLRVVFPPPDKAAEAVAASAPWQPGTHSFKQSIEAEAEDQVRRLRNHPSIVLWCGNNETEIFLNRGERASLPLDVKFQM